MIVQVLGRGSKCRRVFEGRKGPRAVLLRLLGMGGVFAFAYPAGDLVDAFVVAAPGLFSAHFAGGVPAGFGDISCFVHAVRVQDGWEGGNIALEQTP